MPEFALTHIKSGKSNLDIITIYGETALNLAYSNNMSVVSLELIETGESNLGYINRYGDTSLIYSYRDNIGFRKGKCSYGGTSYYIYNKCNKNVNNII